MPPVVHFVRHAQGFHNLARGNHGMPDPLLTELGKEQCAYLRKSFPYVDSVELVVASPLKRTIYTALYTFRDIIAARQLRVLALPEIQEVSDKPCDTGSSVEEIWREFDGEPVDLRYVEDGWNSKIGRWAPTPTALRERARQARTWLMGRPEKEIIVVTHGGFLHDLIEDFSGSGGKVPEYGWSNCELRSYRFDPASGENASLVETQESRTRRIGTEKPLTEAERQNLESATAPPGEGAKSPSCGPNNEVQCKG